MKIVGKASVFLLLVSWLFLPLGTGGCGGGGGGNNTTDNESDNDSDDTAPAACTGETGGSFTDDDEGFALEIPDDSLSECQDASPEITGGGDEAGLVGDNETLVSFGAYLVETNSFEDNELSPEDGLTVGISFDTEAVPEEDQDSRHVYANVLFTDENGDAVVVPVLGEVSNGRLSIPLNSLPAETTWAVVYNPSMEAVVDDETDVSALVNSSMASLTDTPGVLSGAWEHNTWCVMYDASDAYVLTAAATAGQSISDYLKTRVSLPAKIAGALYANGGFREPNLFLSGAGSAGSDIDICTDTTEPYFTILIGGSSHYGNPGGTNPFGRLFVGSTEVDDLMSEPLGSTMDAIAHEMFHAILAGYDLSSIAALRGLNEGAAATIGHTMGWAYDIETLSATAASWSTETTAYVRSAAATETYKVSNQLNTHNLSDATNEAYANQDFYAWVAEHANGGRLDYMATVLENLHTDALSLAGNQSIPSYQWGTGYVDSDIYASLSGTFSSLFDQDLRTLYAAFVADRVYDHNAPSRLRGSDPETAGITTALFDASAMTSVTYNPGSDATSSGTFSNILPYSSRLLTISATTTTLEDKSLQVLLEESNGTYTVGSTSGDIRALVRGTEDATSFSSETATISGWGSTNTTAYILIANTTGGIVSINYRITETEDACSNTSLKATTEAFAISGLECPTDITYGSISAEDASSWAYSGADGTTFTAHVTYTYSDYTSSENVMGYDENGAYQLSAQTYTRSIEASEDECDSSAGTMQFENSYDYPNDDFRNGTSLTMNAAFYVTDEHGHQSNTLNCDITLHGTY